MKLVKKLMAFVMAMMLFVSLSFGAEVSLAGKKLKDVNGKEYVFGKTNKPAYVKFWASWCPICVGGIEDVEMLSKEAKDFDVVTIVTPGRNEKSSKDFIKWYNSLGNKYTRVLLDEKGEITKMLQARVHPSSYFLDKTGKLVSSHPGDISVDEVKKYFSDMMMHDKDMMKKDKDMMHDKDMMKKDKDMMHDKDMMKKDKDMMGDKSKK